MPSLGLNLKNPTFIAGLVAVTLISLTTLFFFFTRSTEVEAIEDDDDEDEVVSDPLDAYKSSTSTPGETPGETPANASTPPKVVKEQRGGFGANAESSLAEKKPAMSKKKEGELKNKEAVTKHKAKDFQGAIECYTKAIQLCRGSGGSADDLKVMHNNRAASFVKLGNLPKAMEDCNRAIAADPTYMKARRRRAGIHMDLGQKDEALIDYYTVCLIPMAQGAPADVEVSTKIEGLLKSLSASKAKDAWEQRAKSGKPLRWPSDHVMRFQLAQQQSSTADATAVMKKAAKASGAEIVEVVCGPKSSLAKTTAAITLARSKMVEGEANETVSKKVALLLYMRAKTHVKNCAWTKAVKDLEASVAASTTVHTYAAALNELGTLHYLKGDFERGYGYLQQSLELVPRCTNTLIKVACYHIDREDKEAGKAVYDDILAKEGENLDVVFHLGLMYFMEDKFDEANAMFEKSTTLSPDFALGHMHKGVSLFRQGKVEEACASLEHAALLMPDSPEIRNILGELYRESAERNPQNIEKAMAEFETALKIDPKYPDAFINKVLMDPANYQQGMPNADVIVGKLKEAIAMDDQCQMAYIQLAGFYLRMGQIDQVDTLYAQVLELARTQKEMVQVFLMKDSNRAQYDAMKEIGPM